MLGGDGWLSLLADRGLLRGGLRRLAWNGNENGDMIRRYMHGKVLS